MAEHPQRRRGAPRRLRRVLVLMHAWAGYLHELQLGIAEYKAQRPEWICTRLQPLSDIAAHINGRDFDGAIAYIEAEYLSDVAKLGIPVVDVSNWLPSPRFPQVLSDHQAIGEMAARYLLGLGLQHFGVVGEVGRPVFSEVRRCSFIKALAKEGFAADSPETPSSLAVVPYGARTPLADWLIRLPKPVGIFAVYDNVAAWVLETCRHLQIRVPEDVCVLGVDNNELISKFTHPPLSSIALPTTKIGFEAARLLDNLMDGRKPPRKPIYLAPSGVVARQSTNLLAIADEDVLAAVRYIREHIHQGITVEDVLRVVPTNRRYLERKFRQHLGRSPLQEIRQMRITKAKELLSGSDLSMLAIARRSGLPNAERLANIFHDEVGLTPTQYRRQFRLRD